MRIIFHSYALKLLLLTKLSPVSAITLLGEIFDVSPLTVELDSSPAFHAFMGQGWVFAYKNGKLAAYYFNSNACVRTIKGLIPSGPHKRLKEDRQKC